MNTESLLWAAGIGVISYLVMRYALRRVLIADVVRRTDSEIEAIVHQDDYKVKGRFD